MTLGSKFIHSYRCCIYNVSENCAIRKWGDAGVKKRKLKFDPRALISLMKIIVRKARRSGAWFGRLGSGC